MIKVLNNIFNWYKDNLVLTIIVAIVIIVIITLYYVIQYNLSIPKKTGLTEEQLDKYKYRYGYVELGKFSNCAVYDMAITKEDIAYIKKEIYHRPKVKFSADLYLYPSKDNVMFREPNNHFFDGSNIDSVYKWFVDNNRVK
jgi:hypothetical protein